MIGHADPTGGWFQSSGHTVDRGRFAGTVWTQEAEYRAFARYEADAVDCDEVAVLFDEAFDMKQRVLPYYWYRRELTRPRNNKLVDRPQPNICFISGAIFRMPIMAVVVSNPAIMAPVTPQVRMSCPVSHRPFTLVRGVNQSCCKRSGV